MQRTRYSEGLLIAVFAGALFSTACGKHECVISLVQLTLMIDSSTVNVGDTIDGRLVLHNGADKTVKLQTPTSPPHGIRVAQTASGLIVFDSGAPGPLRAIWSQTLMAGEQTTIFQGVLWNQVVERSSQGAVYLSPGYYRLQAYLGTSPVIVSNWVELVVEPLP